MRTFVIVFAALLAMAFAQNGDNSVRVVEQPGQQYNLQNPDQSFYQPHNGNGGGASGLNIYPDSAFYRPSAYPNGQGQVQPGVGPTFVNNPGRPNRPHSLHPGARGGN